MGSNIAIFWDVFKIIATLGATIMGSLVVFFIKQVVFSFKNLVNRVESISKDMTEMKDFMKNHGPKMEENSEKINNHEKRLLVIESKK